MNTQSDTGCNNRPGNEVKFLDLTHTLHQEMPVFPGAVSPDIIDTSRLGQHGFREKRLVLQSHHGTHIDAPAHMIADGATLDCLAIDRFQGRAVVYCHDLSNGEKITRENLVSLEATLADSEFLLLATGWDKYWGKDQYFHDFPTLTTEAARWLVQFDLKGIGADVISVDPINAASYENHMILLQEKMIIIENLKNLLDIPVRVCNLSCFPLRIHAADGSPVRAVASF